MWLQAIDKYVAQTPLRLLLANVAIAFLCHFRRVDGHATTALAAHNDNAWNIRSQFERTVVAVTLLAVLELAITRVCQQSATHSLDITRLFVYHKGSIVPKLLVDGHLN